MPAILLYLAKHFGVRAQVSIFISAMTFYGPGLGFEIRENIMHLVTSKLDSTDLLPLCCTANPSKYVSPVHVADFLEFCACLSQEYPLSGHGRLYSSTWSGQVVAQGMRPIHDLLWWSVVVHSQEHPLDNSVLRPEAGGWSDKA